MLTQDIAEIKDGRIITKDGRTVDQIYKGFQLYKSGKAPAEFTAIKEKDQYQGSLDDVKRQIDKYWEKKDAEEVLKKKTGDAVKEDKIIIVKLRDPDNSLEEFLEWLRKTANPGHSFVVIGDPDSEGGNAPKFGFDGDGSFNIKDITVKEAVTDTFDSLDPDETHDVRDIEKETIANNYFRKVLFTSERLQLVLMSLKPGEEIGEEVHPTTDQFFRIEEGKGKAVIDGKEILIKDGSSILIKSGRVHNIINDSEKPLKLYSLYSPPQHQDGLIQKEKET
jgi:mannose-6-phosphate isomerase-like protein (cupin superfamily)